MVGKGVNYQDSEQAWLPASGHFAVTRYLLEYRTARVCIGVNNYWKEFNS